MVNHILTATLSDRKFIAEGTALTTFDFGEQEFIFTAGQYVRVTIPSLTSDDQRAKYRDFSIASSPKSTHTISIAFRTSPSAFKQALLQASLGIAVIIEGPFGIFTLPEKSDKSLVFIAGGTGITVFFSMIQFATEEMLPHTITLLYSNHSPETSIFLPELQTLALQNNRFTFTNHLGHIDKAYITSSIENLTDKLWYIAGPPGMVQTSRHMLIDMGIQEEVVRTEEFTGY